MAWTPPQGTAHPWLTPQRTHRPAADLREAKLDQPVEAQLRREEKVPLSDLLISFLRLGASSFGGGVSGWTHREIVERRGWLDEDNFLKTLTIAQILPGANPVNLAVYIGLKLRGWTGAALAFTGMLAPAFTVILVMSFFYEQINGYEAAHTVLRGLACVGIASSLTMGVKTGKRLRRHAVPILIAVAVFVTVGVLRWPLVPVVAVSIPLSIVAAFFVKEKKHG